MQSFLINFSETHVILSYLVIFIGVLIEGEILLILAGILSRNGYLDFSNIILFGFAAAVVHDLIFWYVGRRIFQAKGEKFLFFRINKVNDFFGQLKERGGLYIFISKFAWNLNRLVLVTSGYLCVPFKKLLQYSIPASLVWSIVFVSLGNIFAHKTDILRQDFKTALIFISIFILAIVIFEASLRKALKKEIK